MRSEWYRAKRFERGGVGTGYIAAVPVQVSLSVPGSVPRPQDGQHAKPDEAGVRAYAAKIFLISHRAPLVRGSFSCCSVTRAVVLSAYVCLSQLPAGARKQTQHPSPRRRQAPQASSNPSRFSLLPPPVAASARKLSGAATPSPHGDAAAIRFVVGVFRSRLPLPLPCAFHSLK